MQQGKVMGTWRGYSQNHATAQGYKKYLEKVTFSCEQKQKKIVLEKVNSKVYCNL